MRTLFLTLMMSFLSQGVFGAAAEGVAGAQEQAATQESECSICQGPIQDQEDKRTLGCQHCFHRQCIEDWLSKGKTTCPFCCSEFHSSDTAFQGATNPHIPSVLSVLRGLRDGNRVNPNLLLAAAENGATEDVIILIEYLQIDVNHANHEYNNGITALMLAAQNGHTETVLALLARGANIHHTNSDGVTALIAAAEHGHTATVNALLIGGADVNHATPGGWTALMWAAENGRTQAIQVLIDRRADVNHATSDGWTALMVAADGDHTQTVQALLDRGANIHQADQDGITALIRAAESGHTQTVQALIDRGANIHQADQDGMTALIRAAESGHTETVRLLLTHINDIDQLQHALGQTDDDEIRQAIQARIDEIPQG